MGNTVAVSATSRFRVDGGDREVSVFIIINEWTDEDSDYECIYGDRFWASEAGALVRLNQIADEVGATVGEGETAVDVHSDTGLERDTYYIRELIRG